MKKAIIIIFAILGLAFSIYTIADDAIHHKGYNWQTTKEYRQMVSEGKETK